MKKFFALLLAALALVTLFAACGENKDNKPKEPNMDFNIDVDHRWDDEVVAPEMAPIIAAAEAYQDRRRFIQYDQLGMNRLAKSCNRSENGIPEMATANKIVHMDCGVFIRNVYNDVFGYTIPGAGALLDPNYANSSNERVFYWVGQEGQTLEDEQKAEKELIDMIEPGDIIYYNYVENNHLFLYLGKGRMIHCTGNDYDYNAFKDGMEPNGSILSTTIDDAFADRHIFASVNKVALFRILNLGLPVKEQAQIRADKLKDIIIYKTTDAPEGVSVNPGDNVKVTVRVKNDRFTEDATFNITDVVPKGMEYVSGAHKEENGNLSWTITVPAGKSVTIEYTLKVKKDESLLGTLISIKDTKIEGYILNDTPVYVGVTLAKDKQESLAAIKGADLKATNEIELINEVYSKIGLSVTAQTSAQYLKELFSGYPNNIPQSQTTPSINKDTVTGLSFVPMLYGGKACNNLSPQIGTRIRRVYEYNVIPGDIIVRGLMLSEGNSNLYVYLGGEKAVGIKDGKVVEAVADDILESLFGQMAFCIIRPSLCYPMDADNIGDVKAPTIKTQPKDMSVAFGIRKGPSVKVTADKGVILTYQWYKNTANSTEGGTPIAGATAAQCAIPMSAFNAGDSAYVYCVVTAKRVFDGKVATSVSNTSKLTITEGKENILLIGTGGLKRDNKFDMGEQLKALLKAGGKDVNVDYITKGNDYNIWESGLTGSEQVTVKKQLDAKTYSVVIIQLGRDYALFTGSTRGKEVQAYTNITNMIIASNPEAQILVTLGPWRQDATGTSWYQRYNDAGIVGVDGIKEAMIKQYTEYFQPVYDAKLIDSINLFTEALKAGIAVYDANDIDYANVNGSYLNACAAYGLITGKSPVGLNVFTSKYGVVSAEDAQKMQEIASKNLGIEFTPTKLDPSKETDKPDVVVTPTEPTTPSTPSTPSTPVTPPVVDDGKIGILVIGSGVLKASDGKYDSIATLQQMLTDAGKEVVVDSITNGWRYNLYEDGLLGANQSKVKAKLETRAYKYVIIQLGRDYVFQYDSSRKKETTAYQNILNLLKTYSPDCEVILTVGPWCRDPNEGDWATKLADKGIIGPEGQQNAHLTQYKTFYETLWAKTKLTNISAAFQKALDAGIEPFRHSTSEYPGAAGNYLIACMNYANITGETPVGLKTVDLQGELTADQIATLQKIASQVVLGK